MGRMGKGLDSSAELRQYLQTMGCSIRVRSADGAWHYLDNTAMRELKNRLAAAEAAGKRADSKSKSVNCVHMYWSDLEEQSGRKTHHFPSVGSLSCYFQAGVSAWASCQVVETLFLYTHNEELHDIPVNEKVRVISANDFSRGSVH